MTSVRTVFEQIFQCRIQLYSYSQIICIQHCDKEWEDMPQFTPDPSSSVHHTGDLCTMCCKSLPDHFTQVVVERDTKAREGWRLPSLTATYNQEEERTWQQLKNLFFFIEYTEILKRLGKWVNFTKVPFKISGDELYSSYETLFFLHWVAREARIRHLTRWSYLMWIFQ